MYARPPAPISNPEMPWAMMRMSVTGTPLTKAVRWFDPTSRRLVKSGDRVNAHQLTMATISTMVIGARMERPEPHSASHRGACPWGWARITRLIPDSARKALRVTITGSIRATVITTAWMIWMRMPIPSAQAKINAGVPIWLSKKSRTRVTLMKIINGPADRSTPLPTRAVTVRPMTIRMSGTAETSRPPIPLALNR